MFTQVLIKELAHMLTLVLKIFSYRVSFKMLFSMYLALVEKELWTYLWSSKFHICTFKNKNHNNDGSRAHRSILFYQCFWTKKIKSESTTRNSRVSLYHLKVRSTQDKVVLFFSCFSCFIFLMDFIIIYLCLGKVIAFSDILTGLTYHTFYVCVKMVNK